ncbi:MAG: DUF2203 domain-containing protein [Cyanobacteria bacterium P01_H01_bin.35]
MFSSELTILKYASMNPSPEHSPKKLNDECSNYAPLTQELEVSEMELGQALADVELTLTGVKERYSQIQYYQKRKEELQHRLEEVRPEVRRQKTHKLREELQQIQTELETIELKLESSLLGWNTIKEPFWQAVRFGGLGIVIGWLLKSCIG